MLKRLFAAAVVLLALSGAALGEALCVNASGVAALTDADGGEWLENGRFEEIFTVREGALYAAGRPGNYRLYDDEGQPLGDTPFAMIEDAGDCLVFREKGLYGAMDTAGQVIVAPMWAQLCCDGEGGWLALDSDPLDELPDEIIHLSAYGEETFTGVFTACGLTRISCGRMAFMDSDGRFGAVDAMGEIVIPAEWRYIGEFIAGMAKVAGNEGVGMIDVDGRVVIAPDHVWLERNRELIAVFDGDSVEVYLTDSGSLAFRLPGPVREVSLVGSALAVAYEDRTCLYDGRGTLLCEGSAQAVFSPGTGGQMIASDGVWGDACQWLVDPDGSPASGRFQQLLALCPGRYAFLKIDGTEYFSTELDSLQKSWDYANMRYGLTDDRGTVLLPAVYREIRAVGDDRLLLISDGEVQLSDSDGVVLKTWITAEGEAPSA